MNAFKHGLAAIQKRREESITTEHEENVRQQILDLIADKGRDDQISTATRILAEVIASDASWLMFLNGHDHVSRTRLKNHFLTLRAQRAMAPPLSSSQCQVRQRNLYD